MARFKPGQSGNPGGRLKGRKLKKTLMNEALEAYGEQNGIDAKQAVINKLIQSALEGDNAAVKLILERLEPAFKPVSRTIEIPGQLPRDLYKKAEKVFALALRGDLTIDEAKQLLSGLSDVVKVKEVIDLEKRLEALEDAEK